MEFKTLLFYLFSTVAVIGALRVITARNPVHAVLYLVLVFFNAAGLWMLLQAEFLAITLIMVYVGAVMVLFLFVVMMLDVSIERLRQGFWRNMGVLWVVGVFLAGEMAVMIFSTRSFDASAMPAQTMPATYSNTRELGRILYTDYAYPVELASVILLVGIIAAVMLTLRPRKGFKAMHPSDQVAVKRSDRVRLVKMAVVKDAAENGGAGVEVSK